jgi:hypothetical protein
VSTIYHRGCVQLHSSGTCDTYTFGPEQPENPLPSGPFIAPDEELLPGISPERRCRTLELRRLRRIEDYFNQIFRLCTEEAWCLSASNLGSGFKLTYVRKRVELKIEQTNAPVTMTRSKRLFEIQNFEELDEGVWEGRLGMQRPEAVDRIVRDIERVIAGIAEFKESWKSIVHEIPVVETEWDRSGLTCILSMDTKMEKSKGGVFVEKTKALGEWYFATSPGLSLELDRTVDGKGKEESEERVRLMREEVQGFLEHLSVAMPNWRGLERAMTRILEPVPAGRARGCEYCEKGHRNGDCQLPEPSMVRLQD